MTPPPAPPDATASDIQISWLVDEYGELLYRVAHAIVHDRQLAEDVVQEVLVKAWTSMPSWEGDVPIRWARTVTRNTALSVVRHRSVRPASRYDDVEPGLLSHAGVDEDVVRDDELRAMWSALGRLDESSRLMLVMHELDDLSYDEISRLTETSVSSVKSKLFRARQTLRKEYRS